MHYYSLHARAVTHREADNNFEIIKKRPFSTLAKLMLP